MSNSIQMDRSSSQTTSTSFPTPMRAIRAWLAERRRVGRVETELHMHSDRELADLGLSRADIAAVARGAFQRA